MISINVYEIVMQIINFCILWWLMSKFMIKPLGRFLEERAAGIKQELNTAEQNKMESEKLVEDQKEAFKTARQEIKQWRQDAEESVTEEQRKLLAQAKVDSEKIIESAHKEISQNVKEVKQNLLSETGELAVMLAKQILKREISDNDQKNLVSEALGQNKGQNDGQNEGTNR
jgi:F-type H+-transporting ATPase subunit b